MGYVGSPHLLQRWGVQHSTYSDFNLTIYIIHELNDFEFSRRLWILSNTTVPSVNTEFLKSLPWEEPEYQKDFSSIHELQTLFRKITLFWRDCKKLYQQIISLFIGFVKPQFSFFSLLLPGDKEVCSDSRGRKKRVSGYFQMFHKRTFQNISGMDPMMTQKGQ